MADINLNYRLDFLPLVTSLPSGDKVIIEHMLDEQISETYKLVQGDAENGVGFAIDEYETEAIFREEVCEGFGFVVLTEDRSQLVAAFFIIPSRFCRDGRAADPIILVHPGHRGKKYGQLCTNLVMEFAPKLGFVCIYFDIFTNNTAMLKIVRRICGAKLVGLLPYSGRVDNIGTVMDAEVYFYSFTKPPSRTLLETQ